MFFLSFNYALKVKKNNKNWKCQTRFFSTLHFNALYFTIVCLFVVFFFTLSVLFFFLCKKYCVDVFLFLSPFRSFDNYSLSLYLSVSVCFFVYTQFKSKNLVFIIHFGIAMNCTGNCWQINRQTVLLQLNATYKKRRDEAEKNYDDFSLLLRRCLFASNVSLCFVILRLINKGNTITLGLSVVLSVYAHPIYSKMQIHLQRAL